VYRPVAGQRPIDAEESSPAVAERRTQEVQAVLGLRRSSLHRLLQARQTRSAVELKPAPPSHRLYGRRHARLLAPDDRITLGRNLTPIGI